MKTLNEFAGTKSGLLVLFFTISTFVSVAQGNKPERYTRISSGVKEESGKKPFRITTLTFGGNGLNVTRVNNQFTVMIGGTGSATFNGHYTIGGGGWGMIKSVKAESTAPGFYNYVKMGYGGIHLGYLMYPGERVIIGSRIMIAGGAAFNETIPESDENSFSMFPVLEPTVYFQVSLSNLLRVELGANYRFVRGTDLPHISDSELSGLSLHIAFLVSPCKCSGTDKRDTKL